MPTYEYRCGNCKHQFEKFSPKITEAKSIECPRCENQAERLISGGAGLLFKGSGFYITDYRSDSYKDAAKQETGDPKPKSTSKEASGSAGSKKSESTKDSSAAGSKTSESKKGSK